MFDLRSSRNNAKYALKYAFKNQINNETKKKTGEKGVPGLTID